MNDNHHPMRVGEFIKGAELTNIGANGRWFCLSFVAITIVDGNLVMACLFAIMIGLSVILEQLAQPFRAISAYGLYAWAAILALATLFMVAL